MKKQYDNASISALKGAMRVRLRPAVIFGSDDLNGCEHAFFEILSNSIDEAREGFGREIIVKCYKDGSYSVEDFGRGIPLDYNEREQRYNYELVYMELYAGGKYNNAAGQDYSYSLGLNGLGACATQYASAYFDVQVKRDGFLYELHFEKGENIGGLHKSPCKSKKTGTFQRFLPDTEVFTDVKIPADYFRLVLKQQAVVNAGVTFTFIDENTGEEEHYCYERGIEGYLQELNADNGISDVFTFAEQGRGRDKADRQEYDVKIEVAFAFNNHNPRQEFYHNSSWLEYGGSPEKACRQAFTYAFDKVCKERDKYKNNEGKIVFQDIADSLLLVTNSFSTSTSYENQTKKAINNRFIQDFMTELLKSHLELWFIEQKAVADKVLEQVLINKRARESSEKQRITVKSKLQGKVDITNRIKKFIDCRSKDANCKELYIVEGDSALGSVKLGRDAEFQAVIPLRGKILNCLKAPLSKIFQSDIIMDLVRVLGCGVELKHKQIKGVGEFDPDLLRWNKIIICTDADVDGFQIRTLVLAMLYRLVPTLLKMGKVYIAESPLYEITYMPKGKGDSITYFAYDEKEKAALLKSLGQANCKLQRSKGLGENEPDMMWRTTMNPQTRRLIQVTDEAEAEMQEIFDLLLGDNLNGRKEFIAANGHNYLELLDLD